MNELGQIAGQDDSNSGFFFWSDGVITRINTTTNVLLGINNKGMVVGSDGSPTAFLWENGIVTYLDGSAAVAVNEQGMVALMDMSLWKGGTLTNLGLLPGPNYGAVSDLNARGQVVGVSGTHAVLWDRGLMTDLAPDLYVPLEGADGFWGAYRPPVRINNRGQVIAACGYSQVPAFLWERDAPLTNLGSLGGGVTHPTDINEQGQIVGWSMTAAREQHAFFWERGVMTDLGKTGEPSEAFGINERGQVVARGDNRGAGGVEVAFIWEKGVRTDIVDLGTGRYFATRLAINNRGQVMGTDAYLRPFRWERGVVTYLSGIDAPSSIGQSPTQRLAGTTGQESAAASMAGQVPGNVRTLLGAPSPNPSTGAAEFAIRLDRGDALRISLYDAAGRLVASRAPEHLAAGSHSLRWDPGVQKAGLYFARMETGSGAAVIRRWVILR